MKTLLSAVALSLSLSFSSAFAAGPMSPIPGSNRPALASQAKCPQKNYGACVRVCQNKYKGTNCAGWCGARC